MARRRPRDHAVPLLWQNLERGTTAVGLVPKRRRNFMEATINQDRSEQMVISTGIDAATEFSCNNDGSHEKGKRNGEQLFILRSQDETMPECIAYWILKNVETASEEKLRHALEDALRARKWPHRRRAD